MTARIATRNGQPARRISPDTAWPIRRADGLTPAQVRPEYRKAEPPIDRFDFFTPMPEQRGWLARLIGGKRHG